MFGIQTLQNDPEQIHVEQQNLACAYLNLYKVQCSVIFSRL